LLINLQNRFTLSGIPKIIDDAARRQPTESISIVNYAMDRAGAPMSEGGQQPCIFKNEGDKTKPRFTAGLFFPFRAYSAIEAA
jgi:hypothetical protein